MFHHWKGGRGRHHFGEGEGGEGLRGRMGRHGRSGRMFQHGDLRLLVLALIAEAPRHGYELIREIEARLGGAYAPSPGVVYPTLTMLEELGLVTSTVTEGTKRQYTITDAGTAHLTENAATVEAIYDRIANAGNPADFGPQVLRAMANLKFALRLRLGRGGLNAAQAAKIAAALDAAALEIEKA